MLSVLQYYPPLSLAHRYENERQKGKEARFSKARNVVAESLRPLFAFLRRPGFNDIHPEQIRSLLRAADLEIRRLAPGSPRCGLSRSRGVRARPHVATCEGIVDTRAAAGRARVCVQEEHASHKKVCEFAGREKVNQLAALSNFSAWPV